MGPELVGLILGLVAVCVILPAVLLLCAKPKDEVPVGASMANRRGVAVGKVQIDPLLKPDWAVKQAAYDAQSRQQHAVYVSSKNLRVNKGPGGGDEPYHVVLRQPSTMADKYALPSHLTKQLGQSSRRARGSDNGGLRPPGMEKGNSGRRSRDGPPYLPSPSLFASQSPSPSLRRPDPAYMDSSSAGQSAGGVGGTTSSEPHPRPPLSASTSRRSATVSPLMARSEAMGSAADRPGTSLEVEGADIFRDTGCEDFGPTAPARQLTGSVAWPGLNDPAVLARATGSPVTSSPPAGVIGGRPPRPPVNPPRAAAQGSMSRAVAAAGSPVASDQDMDRSQSLQQQQKRLPPEKRATSDLVEDLVAEIDWSATALANGDRRSSSVMGAPGNTAAAAALLREKGGGSAPPSSYPTPVSRRQVTVASVPGQQGGSRSLGLERGVSRTISSREGNLRAASRLGLTSAAVANQWTVTYESDGLGSDSGGPPLPPGAPDTSLPGSATFAPAPVWGQTNDTLLLTESTFSDRKPRGLSFGTEQAAAAAKAYDSRSVGGDASTSRTAATWSGMMASQVDDVEAGPKLDGASMDRVNSRAARAQALLARNRNTLKRLAVE